MRILRSILLAVAGLLGLVVLLVAGVLAFSNVPAVRAALRPHLASLLSGVLDLDVEIGAVDRLSPWKGIALSDVRVAQHGQPLLAADTLDVRLGLAKLLPPVIAVHAEGDGVVADLAQEPDGSWNLVQAFAGSAETPAGEAPSPAPSWLGAITVVLQRSQVHVAGVGSAPLELSALAGTAVVLLGEPGKLTVEHLAARLGAGTALAAQGWLELGAPDGVELALDVKSLSGADLKPLVPDVAASASLAGSVEVTGSLDEPRLSAHLASPADGATVDLWAAVAEASAGRHVTASWDVGALDPAHLVEGAPEASISGGGSVDTVLAASGWPASLDADARFWSTSVGSVAAEWLTAQARREGERILLNVQLAAPDGAASAQLAAWLGVAEPHPAGGELTFAVLRPEELPPPVPATLGDSELRGRLTASADRLSGPDRELKAELALEPGRLRGVRLDRALARGALQHGVASLDELRLEGGATRLLAWGWAQIEGPPEQRALRAGLLGPIDLGLLPGGSGKVVARGSAWGTMAAIDAGASLESDGKVVLPGASGTIGVTVAARRVGASDARADVEVSGKLAADAKLARAIGGEPRDLDVKLAWRRLATGETTLLGAAAPASQQPTDRVSVDVVATEPDHRKDTFSGVLERRDDVVAARLDQLRVVPAEGPAWSLLQTATVSYAPDRISAQKLEIGSRAGRIGVDGALARDGDDDLRLTVDDLSLKDVCALAGIKDPCGGVFRAALHLGGTPKEPDVSGAAHVRDLTLAGQSYGGAELTLATAQRLVVHGTLGEAPIGPLVLDARLPLVGGWPAPSLDPQGSLDASLEGSDIQLAGFRAFAERSLSALGGALDVHVTASGTLAAPRLAGRVAASGMKVGLVATGTTWENGRLRASFAEQTVRLDELAFDDGRGGTLSGGGTVALGGEEHGVDLAITLVSLAVLARPEMDAKASGRIAIGGTLGGPRIEGNVHVDSATIRPAFLPGGGGPPPDPTIKILYEGEPRPQEQPRTIGDVPSAVPAASPAAEKKGKPQASSSFMDRLGMAVTVTLGEAVVVQRIDAYVRLRGRLYVTKKPKDALRISGLISSDRGWYMFRGRRIVLQSAYVSFAGEAPINPYLTVTATCQVPDYLITVHVDGTIKKPELELTSEPALDQSDVLSLLLFGKTTSQLTSGQGTELRQEAVGILASYVAPELEQSLMDTFGLASLTFQLPTGTSYGSVGVGRYFGDDIFISIGQTFGGPQGGTTRQLGGLVGSSLTVQYYLTPRITLQTSSSTEGESALDAIWHMRY